MMKKEISENPKKYYEDKFIQKYGEGFGFSEFVYVNQLTKCKIICPDHGAFSVCMKILFGQNRKYACPECSKVLRKKFPIATQDEMVKRIREKFGDRINLDLFQYEGFQKRAKFICTEHNNVVEKSVDSLLSSDKICKSCPNNAPCQLDTREVYLKKVKKIQGGGFKFIIPDEIDYIPVDLRIQGWCPNCHSENNYSKQWLIKYRIKACKYCRKTYKSSYQDLPDMTGEELTESCSLYHVKFYKEGEYKFDKVGICRKGLVWRFRPRNKYGYVIKVVSVYNSTTEDCLRREHDFMQHLESNNKRYRVHDLKNTTICGWTECFIDNDSVAELTIEEYCQNEQS